MSELVSSCHGVATALDVAAGVIVTMKGECIAELIGLATAFASEAMAAATVKPAEKAVQVLEDQLTRYIVPEVIDRALDPLVQAVGRAAGRLMIKATEDALRVDTDGWDGGDGFEIHPSTLTLHANTMHGHAETVTGRAKSLQTKLAGVSFQ